MICKVPGPPLLILRTAGAGRPGLVEEQHHGLRHPGEDLHFERHIAGVGRVLRCINKVEDHVGMIASVADRLLARPERPLAPPVPNLGQKPAKRVARQLQSLKQPRGVAETGRVPQHQRIAAGLQQQIAGRHVGDMGCVPNFAYILGEQRPHQRRLACIGVRNKRQVDRRGRGPLRHAGRPA
jgi:hypothetical protein